MQTKPVDHRASIEKRAQERPTGVRRALIEPAENVIATIERSAAQSYPPEIAQHFAEQLAELAHEINFKFSHDSQAIRGLGTGLYQFER
jgi:hypothetical protein